jgi:hypothetical protein
VPRDLRQWVVAVRADCRHYSSRSLPTGDTVERCRLDVAESMPFACPADCLFFEPRPLSDTGWHRGAPPPR